MASTRDSSQEEEEAFLFAKNLASGSVPPMVLKTAIELDLLENIAKAGPGSYVSPSQLAAQLPSRNPDAPAMVDRILRLLTSYSLLNSVGSGVETLYALAPMSKFFTKDAHGMSLAPLLLMNQDKIFMDTCLTAHADPEHVLKTEVAGIILDFKSCFQRYMFRHHLKDTVLEGGIPFNKVYGMSAFEYNGTDPRFNNIFNQAMLNTSSMTMNKILDLYHSFEGLNTIVDVGGGTGTSLKMIISKYPSIKGINFDLPHVVQHATPSPGIEFVGGDMFVSVPTGDAIFMKLIWHDWSDEHCLIFLKNCYETLPENGKMIAAESIVPESKNTSPATKNVLHVDHNMMAYNPGGKERTEKEFKALSVRAGFTHFAKICCAFNTWIMELYK